VRHDSFICATWLIHTCDMTDIMYDMTHSMCVTWLTTQTEMDSWLKSLKQVTYVPWLILCATWLIHLCDMPHNSDANGLVAQIPEASHICAMTHSMCDMTHSYVWHDSRLRRKWTRGSNRWSKSHMCHDSFYVRHDSFICVTCLRIQTQMDSWLKSLKQVTYAPWLILCATWLILCATWLIHMCDMTHNSDANGLVAQIARTSHCAIPGQQSQRGKNRPLARRVAAWAQVSFHTCGSHF